MAINLLAIKPHKISRDLSGYISFIYGEGGVGKTTLASQLDGALLLATEKGYRALPQVMAQDINSWSDIKQVVRELKKPEVQKVYKSIVVDTIDLAAVMCEKYICNQQGVENLGDIAWGGGYRLMKKEFEEVFQTISKLNYALFFISHSKDKVFKREDGTEYNQIVPSLSPSINEIVRNMSDLQGYAHQVRLENGVPQVVLTLRSMDGSVECKSRFKYIEPEIPFNYESLSNALRDAIDEEEKHKSGSTTDEREVITDTKEYDFDSMMQEFQDLTHKIQDSVASADFKSKWVPKITAIVNKYLGKGKKVSECTPEQAEQLDLILIDLKDEVGKGI